MSTLGAKLSKQEFERYHENIDRLGCSQSDYVRTALSFFDAVIRLTQYQGDWIYKELGKPPSNEKMEACEEQHTYDLDQNLSRKAESTPIDEMKVIP